ncbi:hypothetical protein J2X66_004228 [Pseudomonas sp. 3296]|uniref:hypothetical protein n=1 Tax=Pseudomonas sp. 3296 TaxID=2817753 RepID=UPI002855B7F4|nr:hypothetical protein [Pseudomonas sp. 3296]MDR6917349.1 hypothetical protein [Pseudomonas sp. 3296]
MSKFNETSHPGFQKNTVNETPRTSQIPPQLPVLPEEVLTKGVTPEYLAAHDDELKVTIKPYVDKSYDYVELTFGIPPNHYTALAHLSTSAPDTIVIFSTGNITRIGNGIQPMSYKLFKLADDSKSPESPKSSESPVSLIQNVTVKGM